jgi:CDGSH-type Zn-finger protein
MVFKANTPGEWIFPDRLQSERLAEVAHKCPSGAIRYQRHDGGADESAPPVNLLRLRENGPYAVHADFELTGHETALRATLCRCGQSQRKPYCDGSHAAAGFAASGEPATGHFEPLAQRDGRLVITPLRNGPLRVAGNLELCSGTGRTVAKLGAPNATETRLCRCGQSGRKPFCDGSHLAAGFVAPGV